MGADASMSGTTILAADHVSLRFGGVRALTDVSFQVRPGEIFSIIGPNGAGKTSMVNCISGRYRPTGGRISFAGQDITRLPTRGRAAIGIGRTFQNLALWAAKAGGTGPRQGAKAQTDPARRADGGHESRGEGGHGPLHPRPQRGM